AELGLSSSKEEEVTDSTRIPPYQRYRGFIKAILIICISLGLIVLSWDVLMNDGIITSNIYNIFDEESPIAAHELTANDSK
ncbi:MAG: hypothetical protein R6T90_10615, partial [Dissulfuribacterales bacterium]